MVWSDLTLNLKVSKWTLSDCTMTSTKMVHDWASAVLLSVVTAWIRDHGLSTEELQMPTVVQKRNHGPNISCQSAHMVGRGPERNLAWKLRIEAGWIQIQTEQLFRNIKIQITFFCKFP
jgi:hypothetical protein